MPVTDPRTPLVTFKATRRLFIGKRPVGMVWQTHCFEIAVTAAWSMFRGFELLSYSSHGSERFTGFIACLES